MTTASPAEDLQAFDDIQPATERTQVITVMERKVAQNDKKEFTELSAPRNVFVRPMPFRRWPKAMAQAISVVASFPGGEFNLGNETQLALWLMTAIGGADDAILNIVSLATDLDLDFFDRIDLDDGVKLCLAVIEVNKDFFVQKVLPLISEILPTAKVKVAEIVGQTR